MKTTSAPTTASEILARAATFSPDPFPDDVPTCRDFAWVYGPGDYERATLHRIIAEGKAANRHVDYDDRILRPAASRRFKARCLQASALSFQATGCGVLTLPKGTTPFVAGAVVEAGRFAPGETLMIEMSAGDAGVAAIRIPAASVHAFEWVTGDDESLPPRIGGEIAPDLEGEPVIRLPLIADADLLAAPAVTVGRIRVEAPREPAIRFGETAEEARGPAGSEESRFTLRSEAGSWVSVHDLGGRWLNVDNATATRATLDARVHPVGRRGAFVCSDPQLNRIWGTATYTLRACMQRLVVDGIKRDRMPWAGDQAVAALANTFTFADAQIAEDGLTALGARSEGYVNGISDYSLWWIINHATLLRSFGARPGHQRRAHDLHRFVERLAIHIDDGALLLPPAVKSGFTTTNEGSVFIDWGVNIPKGQIATAFQMLWYWALASAARVLEVAEHPEAGRWADLAERVAATLRSRAWDSSRNHWAEFIDGVSLGVHANFLAVLAGLSGKELSDEARQTIVNHRGSTPFMTTFALRAAVNLGDRQGAVEKVRRLWGPMLEAGATTFWEDFAHGGSNTEMYGRPYGRSLCHAWASGPSFLLPEAILGVRQLGDGWSCLSVDPDLGDLEWASAVIPAPGGDVAVHATRSVVSVRLPRGTSVARNGTTVAGPCDIGWTL